MDGAKIGKGLATAAAVIAKSNVVLAGVFQAFVIYRQARAAWKAANPEPVEGQDWLEDADLIELLKQDSQALEDKANSLLKKYE